MIFCVMSLPKIITVVGPTASGKSACGIEIAKRFGGEVLCVDSRTVYRGMDIGTAKVVGDRGAGAGGRERSIHELFSGGKGVYVEGVSHWGIDLVDPDEPYSISQFQSYARRVIQDILDRGHVPVLVGGTGLWMDAVVDNLSFPDVPPHPEVRQALEKLPLEDLQAEYRALDPVGAETIDLQNARRLIRAIEVCRVTGRPFSELRKKGPKWCEALWLGMDVPKEELDARIALRVDHMIVDGLLDEVRVLKEMYGWELPSMSGIGYRELVEYFLGVVSPVTGEKLKLIEAIETIKTNTRQFAKRQLTWFKRREEIVWVTSVNDAVEETEKFLQQKTT